LERVELIRQYYDNPAITTDVIVGFPGETDEEFERTLGFLERVGFADLHIFQYSMRDGTVAAKMTDQIDPSIKKKRSEILIDKAKEWRNNYIRLQDEPVKNILFEEYEMRNGLRYLCGFNERYVRYGVDEKTAQMHEFVSGKLAKVGDGLIIF
jgi:threonylcarbamoyladenosine tRNA methylthiotransferase MtaB